ncbi:putative iq calmodulin-binding domain-containing protein [Golovinomyces cichoracearum]|uniref:Putative iq calmodulin-binding domain-containing protein n=1 Tax=Golovinomyces cichoracearum TaxID=62708 RepID=A0A420J9F3_9PEZI|nr:putative iq calmodulin-binding domain-containing protein [Golovinomyces cichoracearum]
MECRKRRQCFSMEIDEKSTGNKRIKLNTEYSARPKVNLNFKPASRSNYNKKANFLPDGSFQEPTRLALAADHDTDKKRKLRSQECSRFKSELSKYFPEYDEVIGNLTYATLVDILKADTSFIIFDSANVSTNSSPISTMDRFPVANYSDFLFTDLKNAERVDFSLILQSENEGSCEDTLCDSYFESMHKKPRRAEKTIRNTDRMRAQHDKYQVARLLDGLQGQDWLKLMGISGVPESKKRDYENARRYFIQGCESIMAKFRLWRDKEKRQKIEKDASLVVGIKDHQALPRRRSNPEYSDSENSVTRQLLQEATTRSITVIKNFRIKSETESSVPKSSQCCGNVQESESTSPKPSHREIALIKQNQRKGKTAMAWGYPIPEIPAQEFDLPEGFHTDETFLRAYARRKRCIERIKKKKRAI